MTMYILYTGLNCTSAMEEQASNKTIQKRDSDSLQMPPDGWNASEAGHIRLAFYHGHMIAYFVDVRLAINYQQEM